MSERILKPGEAEAITRKLYMKYKAEVEDMNVRIQKDIDLFGHVSLETDAAQKQLSAKIMKEKEKV
jgi:hypothetical protein